MRYVLIILFSFALTLPIHSTETIDREALIMKTLDDADIDTALMDLSAPPSSIVGGVVNAITGNYFENECDLVIPGANPISLRRSFNSANEERGSLCHGWDFNFPSEIAFFKDGFTRYALVKDRGANLMFECPASHHHANMHLQSKTFRYGVTNCNAGMLSKRYNIKNKLLQYKH